MSDTPLLTADDNLTDNVDWALCRPPVVEWKCITISDPVCLPCDEQMLDYVLRIFEETPPFYVSDAIEDLAFGLQELWAGHLTWTFVPPVLPWLLGEISFVCPVCKFFTSHRFVPPVPNDPPFGYFLVRFLHPVCAERVAEMHPHDGSLICPQFSCPGEVFAPLAGVGTRTLCTLSVRPSACDLIFPQELRRQIRLEGRWKRRSECSDADSNLY